MRNKSFAALGVLALLAATSAFGQRPANADIPFEFRVGTSVMPAGHYGVNRSSSNMQGMLRLVCYECRVSASILTFNVGGGPNERTEGRLVFHKYGETYFLSEAWSEDNSVGSALHESKAERELARSASLANTHKIVLALR